MRLASFVFLALGVVACGGISDNTLGDSGTDSGKDAQTFLCSGSPCSTYCIHESTMTCPTCSALPDGGACPPGSTLQNDCPAGPAMPPGQYCVTYPAPAAPYCSPTIPPSCWDPSPPSNGSSGDVQCGPFACGA